MFASVFPPLCKAKRRYRREENVPKEEEIWQSQRVQHHQLVWTQYASFSTKENCFCQSFQLLFITSKGIYFDSFLFTLSLLFFSSGISEIWPHLETVHSLMFSMALPIRSSYSCQGSAEKMSISYKSFANKHYVFLLRVPGCSSKWSNNVHS